MNNKSIIYIDESGVHKNIDHSSFVLVSIKTNDSEFVNSEIEKIERKLNINYFHWANFGSKAGWYIRKSFIESTLPLPYTFEYRVIRNPIDYKKELHDSIFLLLNGKNVEKVFIDGKQPQWYEKQIKKSLRDKGLSIKHLKTVKDQSVPAIRLADALAGLIRVYFDKPRDLTSDLFRNILQKRNHSASD
jgi:hypothetical protein